MSQSINIPHMVNYKNIYIICGKTDMRKGIDYLATIIQDSFQLDPYRAQSFYSLIQPHDEHPCPWLTAPTTKPVVNFHHLDSVHAWYTRKSQI